MEINGQPGNTGPGNANATPWHAQDYGQLVTAKGWKGPDDVLKSYSELEKFTGAPADRLLRIPDADKLDDAFRGDVFKRIGYTPPTLPQAPAKIEDYGVQAREGQPPEYTNAILTAAHKAGVTKEQLASIVQANDAFIEAHGKSAKEAQDKLVGDRRKAADTALDEKFKDKAKEVRDGITREAARLGYDEKSLQAAEEALALVDEKHVGLFRNLLTDLAQARTEAPLHRGASNLTMDSTAAKQKLDELTKDPQWAAASLERGTPQAVERLMLNAKAAGSSLDEATAKKLAAGTLGGAQ